MSHIIVETATEQPLTDKVLHDAQQQALLCLKARNIIWRYSLLSLDRHRMVCLFSAPDAESVRESYRRAGLPSRPIWAGELMKSDAAHLQACSMLSVIEGTYLPLSQTDWNKISNKVLQYCAEYNVEWLQSYLSRDRTKVIYTLNTPDLTLIQEIKNKLDIPSDRIWLAKVLSP